MIYLLVSRNALPFRVTYTLMTLYSVRRKWNIFVVTPPDEFRCGKVEQEILNTLEIGELRSMEIIKIYVIEKTFN